MNESFLAESVRAIASQRTGSLLLVQFGAMGMVVSSCQMIVMCAWKPLRKVEQSLIFFVAASDFFKALSHSAISAHRLYMADHGMYEARSQIECLQRILTNVISLYVVMISMLMISLDRLIAVSVPIWYSQRQRNIKIFFVITSALVGIGYGSLLLIGGRSDVYQLFCRTAVSPTAEIRTMYNYTDNVFCAIIALINVISSSIACWRLRKAVRANENMRLAKKHIQLNAMKTLIVILILFLFSVYAGTIWTAALASLPVSERNKWLDIGLAGCATLLRGIFDFPIYLLMCKEYRIGFREIFIKKIGYCGNKNNNVVVPAELNRAPILIVARKAASVVPVNQ